MLASVALQAANACLDTFGGNGFAADYNVERKFRETRLYTVVPVANNLILCYVAEHVLGLPRSYSRPSPGRWCWPMQRREPTDPPSCRSPPGHPGVEMR